MTRDEAISAILPSVYKIAKKAKWKYGLDEQEVRQESALAILELLERKDISEIEFPKTYLARYALRGIRKAIQFQNKSYSGTEVPEIADDSREPDVMAIRWAIQSMSRLTEAQRMVLNRIYFKDETEKEASESLGVSRSNVQKTHMRAIENMRGMVINA